MKRKIRKIVSVFLVLCSMGSIIASAVSVQGEYEYYSDSTFAPVDNAGIETSKNISYDASTGKYTLQMENYVTGSRITTAVTTMKATDFVLATDLSHSMPDCINCGKADVDSTGTGLPKSISNCEIFPDDFDTSTVYYVDKSMKKTAYYCSSCEAWFSVEHNDDIHAAGDTAFGTEYYPVYDNKMNFDAVDDEGDPSPNNFLMQFYSQSANENCEENCGHSDWYHPIYAGQFDTSADFIYTQAKGDSDQWNVVKYCTTCKYWYRKVNSDAHADGGKHSSNAYYPFELGEVKNDRTLAQFHVPCKSRMVAAKEAITAFVDQVYEMSLGFDGKAGTDDDINHRVAIVGFGGNNNADDRAPIDTEDKEFTRTGIYSIWDSDIYASEDRDVNNFKSYFVFGKKGNGAAGAEADKADYYYSHALRDVTSSKEMSVIEEGISELSYNYGTYINLGLEMVKGIFEATYTEDESDKTQRNRVAVVFTDGEPDGDGSGVYDLADESIQPSYDIKNSSNYNATVYSIGIFKGANASQIWSLEDNAQTDIYMHMLSSNYPTAYDFHEGGNYAKDAKVKKDPLSDGTVAANLTLPTIDDVNPELLTTDADGNTIVDTTKSGYYLTAANADELVNAFEGIATESTTGGASVTLDTSTVVQDTLTDTWEIDGDVSNVTAYTMTYTGDDASGNKLWASAADDTSYTPTVSGKTVQVTGFDFAGNYVGKDVASDGSTNPHGKKLVLVVPVKPTAGNTGGTAQLTNVPEQSGIIYNGEVQEHFGSPAVDVPTTVSLSVVTDGNNTGSSFNIDTAAIRMDGYKSNSGGNGNYLEANERTDQLSSTISSGDTDSFDKVIVGSSIVIKEKAVSGYKVEVSVDGGTTWSELTVGSDGTATADFTVTPAMQIIVRNTRRNTELTITKTVTRAEPDQSFLFDVSGSNGTSLRVVIPAEAFAGGKTSAAVTIKDMEIGDYTVTEVTDWPFRFSLTDIGAEKDTDAVADFANNSISVTITPEGENVTFESDRTFIYWLSGDCWKEFVTGS